ncbi:PEP-CTERM sorting domain-containing protein [Fundidesulfovibrio putealis]|uniref:PEP-CTERM sorting domain-containing protein n=1 Tax=Fundidesulfovibrio putealis TaxID=270496 RepID=UPI0004290BEC|nr:PEP-CTERM sorting domain-containing protein [Fundidesulfovibrio putealis]
MSLRRQLLACLLCSICFMATPVFSIAATHAQINNAISTGLSYLASQQQAGGYWNYGGYEVSATASAVLAMIEQGNSESSGLYKNNVKSGLQYIFNTAQFDSVNKRVWWGPEDTYQTGLALSTIASTQTPNAIVGSGPLAGLTYKQVAENVVKYFAEGQNSPTNNGVSNIWRGGWHYGFRAGDSDNSTSQWPVVGLIFAQTKMGIPVPASVPTELSYWTSYIQDLSGTPATNPSHGSSGYQAPQFSYNDVSKTGGLLLEFYLEGKTKNDPVVQAATDFINRNWISGGTLAGAPWDGNFGQPYAMWSIYKGLQVIYGLEDNTAITNLHAPGVLDPGTTWNWYQDYADWLVKNQNADGSWNGYSYWTGALADGWNINMLLATQIAPPQPSVPEPATVALMGVGLAGLFVIHRRKRDEKK